MITERQIWTEIHSLTDELRAAEAIRDDMWHDVFFKGEEHRDAFERADGEVSYLERELRTLFKKLEALHG